MRFLGLSMLLSSWLLLSAFVLPHTAATALATGAAAFAVSLFAALAVGRPAARFGMTAVAFLLGGMAALVAMPAAAAISNAVVGAMVAALSLVSPVHGEHPRAVTDPPVDDPDWD